MRDAIHRLDEAGHVAYVVGGSVRDFLLSREVKDHDLATSAGPDELCELFPNAITVGKAFGVLKVPYPRPGADPVILEVATFRRDGTYSDHRHPSKVTFSGPLEDASRRDFTVNALYYDSKTQRVWDAVSGMKDLEGRVLRAIGEPDRRFKEDALRLLRAVRFTANLGFQLEMGTADAVRKNARLIRKVSSERIRDELSALLKGPRPAQAVKLLFDLGLLPHVLPEVDALRSIPQPTQLDPEADAWAATLRTLQVLSEDGASIPVELGWAALLAGIGKPEAFRREKGRGLAGHELLAQAKAESVCKRMKLSRAEVELVGKLVADQLRFKDVFQMREATLVRWLTQDQFPLQLRLHRAQALATDGNLAPHEFCRNRLEDLRAMGGRAAPRLIDGNDLIQLGFPPGREFSQILRAVEDLAIEGVLKTKEQALEYVVKHFVG
ncbi:MAG: CCA tRNA nucleotidyltransferase [Bdellovibrionales bacterium]|nr:CCA tRNA nucleotidyltransferase [Bdellovibrionales bacterium]